MAGEVVQGYHAILNAARQLPPAEQLRLAKELVSGDHLVTFWEDWQRQLAEQGDIASDAEIDVSVTQVRAERQRHER
jgi:hypothetical protein